MKIAHRIGYYLAGFAIGIVILIFFVGGSGASCEYDYGPDARVLKNIRLKERIINQETLDAMKSFAIDTTDISSALKSGDVNFSKSNTDLDSCKVYVISHKLDSKTITFNAENCSKKATISNLKIVD